MSRASLLWFGLAVAAGALLPIQSGVNVRLRLALGSPIRAAFISFLVGTVVLAGLVLLFRSAPGEPRQAPWWAWLGGLLGALHVSVAILLAPRLGAAALFAALVAGQLIAASAIDHFGLVGYPVLSFSPARALGIVLLGVGALLILRR